MKMLKRCITALLLFPLLVFAETFVEGKDFEVISKQQTASKPSMVEFFSFGCPWCYKLEPTIQSWKTEHPQVDFSRVPVVFHESWKLYAKAYYAAHLLQIEDKMSAALFKAVQVDKKSLNNEKAMIDFFVAQGVDKETAESAFQYSTIIDMKLKEGDALMANYQIKGVPAFIVNGRYKVDLQMAKNPERLVGILDHLLSLKHG
jgi:thiol:disulfide interchange protein DsbA